MQPAFQNELGTMLPEEMVFPHFAEREAAWLLHQQMTGPTRIAELRRRGGVHNDVRAAHDSLRRRRRDRRAPARSRRGPSLRPPAGRRRG